jgi:hypothetical protein
MREPQGTEEQTGRPSAAPREDREDGSTHNANQGKSQGHTGTTQRERGGAQKERPQPPHHTSIL